METSTIINDISVAFSVTFTGKVMFKVNESYEKKDIDVKNKVAVVRWLLQQLKIAQEEYDELSCIPYSDDGYGELRHKCFSKIGFSPQGERLVWKR